MRRANLLKGRTQSYWPKSLGDRVRAADGSHSRVPNIPKKKKSTKEIAHDLSVVCFFRRCHRKFSQCLHFPDSGGPVHRQASFSVTPCEHPIRFYDNIPIISFILLRGRCRTAEQKYSWRYPFGRADSAACWRSRFFRNSADAQLLVFFIFYSRIVRIAFMDSIIKLIPDILSLPAFRFFFWRRRYRESSLAGSPDRPDVGGGILFAIRLFL